MSSGGSVASGGFNATTGGAPASPTGGSATTTPTGGALASGGAGPVATGGTSQGGAAPQTGGTNTGGTSGGSPSSGGSVSTGGVSTGGASGGSHTGGTASGGASTGGVTASGGSPQTGGAGGTTSMAGATSTGGSGVGGFPPLPANVTVHVAGDSTAAIFPASDPTGRVGWAAVFQQFFTTGVTVNDAAQSGRSTKSFIDEGFWSTLKAKIKTGDYVFIEFAHNDEKSDDPARYTDPATTFRTNLKLFISDTRAAGGVPILLTPISRKQFSGTTITQSHGAYPAAVIAVGKDTNTPVIDMTEKTRIWLEGLGPTAAIPYFATDDNTHLSAKGAPEVAKLVVKGIRELGLPLSQRLVP